MYRFISNLILLFLFLILTSQVNAQDGCFTVRMACGNYTAHPKENNSMLLDVIAESRCLIKWTAGWQGYGWRFTLLSCPSGMTVNNNGVINWNPSSSLLGQTFQVTVKAEYGAIFTSSPTFRTLASETCTFDVNVDWPQPIEP